MPTASNRARPLYVPGLGKVSVDGAALLTRKPLTWRAPRGSLGLKIQRFWVDPTVFGGPATPQPEQQEIFGRCGIRWITTASKPTIKESNAADSPDGCQWPVQSVISTRPAGGGKQIEMEVDVFTYAVPVNDWIVLAEPITHTDGSGNSATLPAKTKLQVKGSTAGTVSPNSNYDVLTKATVRVLPPADVTFVGTTKTTLAEPVSIFHTRFEYQPGLVRQQYVKFWDGVKDWLDAGFFVNAGLDKFSEIAQEFGFDVAQEYRIAEWDWLAGLSLDPARWALRITNEEDSYDPFGPKDLTNYWRKGYGAYAAWEVGYIRGLMPTVTITHPLGSVGKAINAAYCQGYYDATGKWIEGLIDPNIIPQHHLYVDPLNPNDPDEIGGGWPWDGMLIQDQPTGEDAADLRARIEWADAAWARMGVQTVMAQDTGLQTKDGVTNWPARMRNIITEIRRVGWMMGLDGASDVDPINPDRTSGFQAFELVGGLWKPAPITGDLFPSV